MTPGTIIVEHAGQPFTTSSLQAYSSTGSLLSTGQATGANQIVNGIAVLNGSLFLGDGAGYVDNVNLVSGAVTSSFYTGSVIGGLAALNGSLLTFNPFTSGGASFKVYSTSGSLLQTIVLGSVPSTSLGPVTSDGTSIYLADEYTGMVYQYSLTGALLNSFNTNTGSGFFGAALSGIAYSAANNSLWISDDKTDQLIDLSTSGTLLSELSTGAFIPANLAVVATSAPEPGYAALFFFGLAMAISAQPILRRYRIG